MNLLSFINTIINTKKILIEIVKTMYFATEAAHDFS